MKVDVEGLDEMSTRHRYRVRSHRSQNISAWIDLGVVGSTHLGRNGLTLSRETLNGVRSVEGEEKVVEIDAKRYDELLRTGFFNVGEKGKPGTGNWWWESVQVLN